MNTRTRAHLILFFTALIWGLSFASQAAAMDYLPPFAFNAIRYLLGALVLLPLILFRKTTFDRHQVLTGLLIGLVLTTASSLQQVSLQVASAGKAGFITGLYIVFVPFLARFAGEKVNPRQFIALALALAGLALMSLTEGGGLDWPDFFLLICAVLFAVHIILIERRAKGLDSLALAFVQFVTAGSLAILLSLIFGETLSWVNVKASMGSILFVGIFCCGLAYTLQIVGQKGSDPTTASLIMSLESVFAVIGGALFLGERLSARQLWGCAFILAAVVYSTILDSKNRNSLHKEDLSNVEETSTNNS
ncbi:MAG: DMT family transporter [Eubacteriales bacterium]|nr:DMT family transporter [Eubacteriales bacterium]